MAEFERNVIQYESIVKKIIKADKELEKRNKLLAKRGGIYAKDSDDNILFNQKATPSAFLNTGGSPDDTQASVKKEIKSLLGRILFNHGESGSGTGPRTTVPNDVDHLQEGGGPGLDKKDDKGYYYLFRDDDEEDTKQSDNNKKTILGRHKPNNTAAADAADTAALKKSQAKPSSSLPSSFVRKETKQDELGLAGGRLEESQAKLSAQKKIRAEFDKRKLSITESIISALGIKIFGKEKIAKDSLVSGEGRPINKQNVFKDLVKKVDLIEQTQESFAQLFSQSSSLVSGAANLTSAGVLAKIGAIGSTALPIIGVVIAIATAIVTAHLNQYEAGGTRDKRKKLTAEDDSLTGIENENAIASGEILFFSNPSSLQGMPRGNSNTIGLRDGHARYEQTHQGSY